MELADGAVDTVHPEVRAHINSLASALGGVSADDDGQYQLGDDALEVLRDIKRWLRFYDEKTNRMDVARCLADANLIEGDLLPILAMWPESATENKFKARLALACLELIVPLTWPIEQDRDRMTVNHHRHIPVLELAQVQYKRAIINLDSARILHTAVRAALPSIAIPVEDRRARDQGIIKLILYFLRNMASIAPAPHIKYEDDESQISRSATIDAFSYQDIFHFLLTLASNVGDDFRTEDTIVMEIIYHLVKRVDVESVFMDDKQMNKAKAGELSALMHKETAMLKSYNRKGPTRHNRFGTMIWVPREGGRMSTLSGQDVLADPAARNEKMDSSKIFRPPRRARKEDKVGRELGPPVSLNSRARAQLKSFVEEFLDSGFNPLFQHVRKSIDREAPHVMQYHRRIFFYLVSWFLEAERERRRSSSSHAKPAGDEPTSFNLVAGVLNQETFITLNRALHESFVSKEWHELTAVMRCLTQVLLTVQDMAGCGNEDDEEIAENVLSRLFYEEATHDAMASIIRTYKDQGFDYLDAATELVHHFLRILEAYSKQNVDMQIRSRKRSRRVQQAAKATDGAADTHPAHDDNDAAQAEDDAAAAARTSTERRFDFGRFCSRFTPQGVVDSFVALTRYYPDLSEGQLKRAHRYFYRLAFKLDMSVMLFRVDIIHLFHKMIKGPEPLDSTSAVFGEWEALVRQLFRKCFKKLRERPELVVEMLFSKTQSMAYYLEYGHQKQTKSSKRPPKAGAELEFKKQGEDRDRQVAIVVGALLDRGAQDHLEWTKMIIQLAERERRSWAAAEEASQLFAVPSVEEEAAGTVKESKTVPDIAVEPDTPARRTAMFKDSYLRLLLTLCGLQRLGTAAEETPETNWVIAGHVSADYLQDSIHFIKQAEFSPPTFEDGSPAEQQLRRKAVQRERGKGSLNKDEENGAGDDEDEEEETEEDVDFLFPAGGPTTRKASDGAQPKKTGRRRRRPEAQADEDEKARRRRLRELEKARRIKSALYVRDGDDDFDAAEDEAFFARERAIAARAREAAALVMRPSSAADAARKRKANRWRDDEDDDGDSHGSNDDDDGDVDVDLDDDNNSSDNLGSSPRIPVPSASETEERPAETSAAELRTKRRRFDEDADQDDDQDQDLVTASPAFGDQDANEVPVSSTRRPRVRSGFIIDSDDDDDD